MQRGVKVAGHIDEIMESLNTGSPKPAHKRLHKLGLMEMKRVQKTHTYQEADSGIYRHTAYDGAYYQLARLNYKRD